MLYFAYGANMNHRAMMKLCPDFCFLGCAKLKGYHFAYDGLRIGRGGIYANIHPHASRVVYGGLFRIQR